VLSRNIIWGELISLKHLGVFEKEFEAVLFEQCCEVRYPKSKGYRSSYLKGSSRFPRVLPGGALKRTIQHFNCTLIVDMDGEKKVLFSYNHLFSPGQLHPQQLQTNPLAKDTGKYGLLRELYHQPPTYGIRVH
jgi:hypothetical protein